MAQQEMDHAPFLSLPENTLPHKTTEPLTFKKYQAKQYINHGGCNVFRDSSNVSCLLHSSKISSRFLSVKFTLFRMNNSSFPAGIRLCKSSNKTRNHSNLKILENHKYVTMKWSF